jgi:hypothetical protein
MQVSIDLPNQQDLITMAENEMAIISGLKIANNEQLQSAADKRNEIKGYQKKWEDMRTDLKAPILEAGRKIDALFKPAQEKMTAAVNLLNKLCVDYTEEQNRIRAEAQRKADEIARKERERLDAEARKAREIAQAKADELARHARDAEEAGRAEEAKKLQAKAESIVDRAEAEADTLEMRASIVTAPTIRHEEPKAKGLAMKTLWYAKVVNADIVPNEYKVVNEKALDDIAKATKGAIKIPGVEFYSKSIAATTRT